MGASERPVIPPVQASYRLTSYAADISEDLLDFGLRVRPCSVRGYKSLW
jgi:hypothetical protein